MNPASAPRWPRRIILLAFTLSGVSGLIYELVWMRRLTLIFGSTTLAVSTVLAALMGGLALGSYLLGRVADRRTETALFTYGLLGGGGGTLYAVNALGAGTGTALTTYLFLPQLGLWRSQLLAAMLSLAAGGAALGLGGCPPPRRAPGGAG